METHLVFREKGYRRFSHNGAKDNRAHLDENCIQLNRQNAAIRRSIRLWSNLPGRSLNRLRDDRREGISRYRPHLFPSLFARL